MFIELQERNGDRAFVNTRYIDSFWVDSGGIVHVTMVGYEIGSYALKSSLEEFIQLLKKCNVDVEVSEDA